VGSAATITPFKGRNGAAWKGAGTVSGWCHVEEKRWARCDVAGGGGGGGSGRGGGGPADGSTRARWGWVERRVDGVWTGEAGAYNAWAPSTVLGFKPVQTESINSNTFKFILNNFKLDLIQNGPSQGRKIRNKIWF
jgi:hypothetical protein